MYEWYIHWALPGIPTQHWAYFSIKQREIEEETVIPEERILATNVHHHAVL